MHLRQSRDKLITLIKARRVKQVIQMCYVTAGQLDKMVAKDVVASLVARESRRAHLSDPV